MKYKQRLSASVDADLIRVAERAAKRGQVSSVSAWVNDALRLKLEHEQRLQGLDSFIRAYEAEHGEITHEEIERASRRANSRAVAVRSLAPARVPGARRRKGVG
jgi:Arc/MetJ-type ribon-helix-helix transcriptional regulator